MQNSVGSRLNYLEHSQQFNDSFIIGKIELNGRNDNINLVFSFLKNRGGNEMPIVIH